MKVDNLEFKDSLCFMPIALDQFPNAPGVDLLLAKGHFSDEFNKPANWGYKGPFPAVEMYGGKANKNYDTISNWLAQQTGQFNFNQQYFDYCLSDTVLLRASCIKFRQIIKEICGLEPFVPNNTIAGLAMSAFTTKFMELNTIGVISRNRDMQSQKAQRWLSMMSASTRASSRPATLVVRSPFWTV